MLERARGERAQGDAFMPRRYRRIENDKRGKNITIVGAIALKGIVGAMT